MAVKEIRITVDTRIIERVLYWLIIIILISAVAYMYFAWDKKDSSDSSAKTMKEPVKEPPKPVENKTNKTKPLPLPDVGSSSSGSGSSGSSSTGTASTSTNTADESCTSFKSSIKDVIYILDKPAYDALIAEIEADIAKWESSQADNAADELKKSQDRLAQVKAEGPLIRVKGVDLSFCNPDDGTEKTLTFEFFIYDDSKNAAVKNYGIKSNEYAIKVSPGETLTERYAVTRTLKDASVKKTVVVKIYQDGSLYDTLTKHMYMN